MYKLYGDGIHDDYPAIQELIDSGICELALPAPKVRYLISQTLVIPSGFRLVLPRFAEIRLMDGANCLMLRNRWVKKPDGGREAEILAEKKFGPYDYTQILSTDPENACADFEVCGGIWNFNNLNQKPNPFFTKQFDTYLYNGFGIQFFNVNNFCLRDMTLKNPLNYAVTLELASHFTVENITFDFNKGNPAALNMDGIHLHGNCHYGYIHNLRGACYDDTVALNAHEGIAGPITNICIDGIYAEKSHSAVRLLSVEELVTDIHITNIFGTYYQYCITLSKYYKAGFSENGYGTVAIDNVFASKADRAGIYPFPDSYVFPLIHIDDNLSIKNLFIDRLSRSESTIPVETLFVSSGTVIENLSLSNIVTENHTGKPMPLLVNHGEIQNLKLTNIVTGGDEVGPVA